MSKKVIKPRVSVIIPFYNRFEWTIQAVNSVLSQTYKDFEVILVDDGSNDKIILPPYIKKNKKVRYYKTAHGGPSKSRNYGMSLADGEYIAFLDSDDLFMPDKLEKQVSLVEKYRDIRFLHTSYVLVDAECNYLKTYESGHFSGMMYPEIINNCPIATPTVMLHRQLISEFKFPESVRIGEDNILWIQISRKYFINGIIEPLVRVRKHDSNTAFDVEKFREGRMNILNYAFTHDTSLSKSFMVRSYALVGSHVKSLKGNCKQSEEEKIDELINRIRRVITNKYIKSFIIHGVYPAVKSLYKIYVRFTKNDER